MELTPGALPETASSLRAEVRRFLAGYDFTPRVDSWLTGFDPAFSRALGDRGWLGMTLPERYGGHGRSPLERFAVIEELLAAGSPVAAHRVADRQMGPSMVSNGSVPLKERFLPSIARGECFFAIGMSEPDSGSDLASVRTRAERMDDGWALTGTKVWTSGAQHAHAILVLARTSPPGEDRHAGLSQFIVELPAAGVTIRPIRAAQREAGGLDQGLGEGSGQRVGRFRVGFDAGVVSRDLDHFPLEAGAKVLHQRGGDVGGLASLEGCGHPQRGLAWRPQAGGQAAKISRAAVSSRSTSPHPRPCPVRA